MTNFAAPPPPPPMSGGAAVKAGPIGWGAVVAGVLGLLALILPWFTPKATGNGKSESASTSFHAWNGFFFLIIAPVVLILAAVMWFQAMRGQHNSRFAGSTDPVRSLSLQSIVFGAISLALGLLSFVILTATYKFKTTDGNVSWSKFSSLLKAEGAKLERGPQVGIYFLLLGAVVLIVVGVLGVVRKPAPAPAGIGFDGGPQAFGNPPQGFNAPPQGNAQGFDGPPPQGFDGRAQGFDGPPQGGFPPPPPPPAN